MNAAWPGFHVPARRERIVAGAQEANLIEPVCAMEPGRCDHDTARLQHTRGVGQEQVGVKQMLDHLVGHDGVEDALS
jgi:hypothetical protein